MLGVDFAFDPCWRKCRASAHGGVQNVTVTFRDKKKHCLNRVLQNLGHSPRIFPLNKDIHCYFISVAIVIKHLF